jgi:hypothetical protein
MLTEEEPKMRRWEVKGWDGGVSGIQWVAGIELGSPTLLCPKIEIRNGGLQVKTE